MLNPFDFSLKFQEAALRGSRSATRIMTAGLVKLLEQQEHLLHPRVHRRAEDAHTRPLVMPGGPDLQDHYGRRCHDVDVEHL